MCDCYYHKCEICEETIPMHIADFAFPRKDFKVYCHKHIGQAPIGAVIFELVSGPFEEYDHGWKCAIFGPKVGQTDNCPNISGKLKEQVVTGNSKHKAGGERCLR